MLYILYNESKRFRTVGAVSLWWYLAVLICYALVYSSLGNEAAKPDTKAWIIMMISKLI